MRRILYARRNSAADPWARAVQDAARTEFLRRKREYTLHFESTLKEAPERPELDGDESLEGVVIARIARGIHERVDPERLRRASRAQIEQALQRAATQAGLAVRSGETRAPRQRSPEVEAAVQMWWPTARTAARAFARTRFFRDRISTGKGSESADEFIAHATTAWVEHLNQNPREATRLTETEVAARVQLICEDLWREIDRSQDIMAQRRAAFGQAQQDTVLERGELARPSDLLAPVNEASLQEAENAVEDAFAQLKQAKPGAYAVYAMAQGTLRVPGYAPKNGAAYSIREIAKITRQTPVVVTWQLNEAARFLRSVLPDA